MTAFENGFEVLNNKPESNVKFKVLFSENNDYNFINSDGSERVKVVVDKKGNKFVSIKKDEEKKLETFFADNKIKDVEIDETNYDEEHEIPQSELVALCSNCHSMVHRRKEAMDVDELKNIVQNKQNN